jgi:hypothetical protein
MKPSRTASVENMIPVNLPSAELGDGGMASVRASQRRSNAETPLGEVEAIADRTSDSVIFHPPHQGLIDPSLIEQIFQQPANWIVGDCRNNGGVISEAAL